MKTRNNRHNPPTRAFRMRHVFIAVLLVASSATQVLAQIKDHVSFVNVADSTQGLQKFSEFPAINDRGSVVFVATDSNGKQGVFKWRAGTITTIASESSSTKKDFDDAVINATDLVAYAANPSTTGNNRAIFTSDGVETKTIVDAKQQGIVGRFLGSPSINDSGEVAFLAVKPNFSQAVLKGDGEQLTVVADAASSPFVSFGNPAINNSGRVTFVGTGGDDSVGVFIATPSAPGTYIPVSDPSSPIFSDPFVVFGDPVINEAGIIANSAFPSFGNMEIFTGNGRGVSARTDVDSPFFTSSEHPSINNRGTVAFFATELSGGQGIFVETTGGASPVAVIEAGDDLFGSKVTRLKLGRFALNAHNQMAFRYELQDGRSGVAIVSLHK